LFFFIMLSIAVTPIYAVNSSFNTGIGRNGTSGLNISADTPGPIKYQLEFKPLGGGRKVTTNTYDDASKNMATTQNVNCLDGAGCVADETLVRGVYVAGTEGGYAVAKRFTLFCGSIQVTGEQTTQNWDSAFYQSFADDFLNNGPSAANCPSPTAAPSPTTALSPTAIIAVSSATVTPKPVAQTIKRTPTAPDEDDTLEQAPTPFAKPHTPIPNNQEEDTLASGFIQNLPLIIAVHVLVGILGYVLYQTNPTFHKFIANIGSKLKKKESRVVPPSDPPDVS
jgi:hypothetical protein